VSSESSAVSAVEGLFTKGVLTKTRTVGEDPASGFFATSPNAVSVVFRRGT
jgi:hypothetical protein